MNSTDSPAVDCRLDGAVGRLQPERDKPLSYRQREALAKAPIEWGRLPAGMGCTNATLEALERRGLVETAIRDEQSGHYPGVWLTVWVWRKTPNAKVSGAGTASAGLPGWQANGKTE